MHINQCIITFRQIEDEIDMLIFEVVEPLGSRHAPYDITTHLHGFYHQLSCAFIAVDTLLRECYDLKVTYITCLFFGSKHTAKRNQFRVQITDVDICSKFCCSIHDTLADRAQCTFFNIFNRVGLNALMHYADGIFKRLVTVFSAAQRRVALVKMHVGVDKGRRRHHAVSINDFYTLHIVRLNVRLDSTVLAVIIYQNILQTFSVKNIGFLN